MAPSSDPLPAVPAPAHKKNHRIPTQKLAVPMRTWPFVCVLWSAVCVWFAAAQRARYPQGIPATIAYGSCGAECAGSAVNNLVIYTKGYPHVQPQSGVTNTFWSPPYSSYSVAAANLTLGALPGLTGVLPPQMMGPLNPVTWLETPQFWNNWTNTSTVCPFSNFPDRGPDPANPIQYGAARLLNLPPRYMWGWGYSEGSAYKGARLIGLGSSRAIQTSPSFRT
jgi:hypothetical protein